MADLAGIIFDKAKSDQEWKTQRQAERNGAVALRDAAVTEITSNPQQYARYLDMQGDNPTYSPGNIAMVMYANDKATQIGTVERWQKMGRTVMASEMANGVQIFCRSTYGKGYTLKDAYDVAQTQGRPVYKRPLENETPAMEKALATVLNYAAAPVEVSNKLDSPARYDDTSRKILVNPEFPDNEAFGAIVTEVALSRIHRGNDDFDRAENLLDAQSVSYILCRKYGVQAEKPDTSNLAALYDGWAPDRRLAALNIIQNMSKQIGNSIDRAITPPQRNRNHIQAQAR